MAGQHQEQLASNWVLAVRNLMKRAAEFIACKLGQSLTYRTPLSSLICARGTKGCAALRRVKTAGSCALYTAWQKCHVEGASGAACPKQLTGADTMKSLLGLKAKAQTVVSIVVSIVSSSRGPWRTALYADGLVARSEALIWRLTTGAGAAGPSVCTEQQEQT